MWVIFWSVVWKIILSWLSVFGGLFVLGVIQGMISGFETLDDSLVNYCLMLWLSFGALLVSIGVLIGEIMLIIEIWN
jgi:hypothetical protein